MDEYEYEFRPINMEPPAPWSPVTPAPWAPITRDVAQWLLNEGGFEVRQRPVGSWRYYLPKAVLQ